MNVFEILREQIPVHNVIPLDEETRVIGYPGRTASRIYSS